MKLTHCPEAWHAGLYAGLLHECRFEAGHRGWHRDESGDLSWGGKLTAAERKLAAELRSQTAAI
jgi:hypothetical protein